MSIPKIIHACWFGPGIMSEIALQCQESWKLHCPDYEFKIWNEANSKEFQSKFYRDAIREKQYAFASDAIRVGVLEAFGGIYLDMDMLLLQPLDTLLEDQFFTGFEVAERPAYGLFGGVAGHRFFRQMNQFYQTQRYNRYSPPVITHTFKELITKVNLKRGEQIYAVEVFYSLSYQDRDKPYQDFISKDSIAVHLWDHSWKETKAETTAWLIRQLWAVHEDKILYHYPADYFKRYRKEFGRKLYHKLIGRSSH